MAVLAAALKNMKVIQVHGIERKNMDIINANLFLTLMVLSGYIDEVKCADLRRIADKCKIESPNKEETIRIISCLEDIKKGLAVWNPDKFIDAAIDAVRTATYYKELASSYEKTIVKLNDALRFKSYEKMGDPVHANITIAEEILIDTMKKNKGDKSMQAIALQTFIQTVGPVSNECGELIKKYME